MRTEFTYGTKRELVSKSVADINLREKKFRQIGKEYFIECTL